MYADVGSDVEDAAVWVERGIERRRDVDLGLLEPAGQPNDPRDGRPRLKGDLEAAPIPGGQPPPMGGASQTAASVAGFERGGLAWRTLTSGSPASGRSAVELRGSRNNQWCPDPKGANAAGPSPAQAVCTLPPASGAHLGTAPGPIVSSAWRCDRTSGPQTHYNVARPKLSPGAEYLAC